MPVIRRDRVLADSNGVPVGAFIVHRSRADELLQELRARNQLKSGLNVTRYSDDVVDGPPKLEADMARWTGMLAVHVASEAAEQFEKGIYEGDVLYRLVMEEGVARWVGGLRALSPECRQWAKLDTVRWMHSRKEYSGARFTFIELFSGIGGFALGLKAVGGEPVFASELSRITRDTYEANFPGHFGAGDITEIDACDIPDHDILTGGFPCQSFCKAGDRTGLNDSRGELFFEVVRVLKEKTPKAFLLENVANLVTLDNGRVFEEILSLLRNLGYRVHHKIINSAAYTPQTRLRVYLVGFLSPEVHDRYRWPPDHFCAATVRSILEPDPPPPHLLLTPHQFKTVQETYSYRRDRRWRIANVDGKARTLMSSYRGAYRLYSEFVPVPLPDVSSTAQAGDTPPPDDIPMDPANEHASNDDENLQPGQWNEGENTDDGETHLQLRFYSPRECARLMGFPESYIIDSGHSKKHAGTFYHQIGNAVCPPVIEAIAEEMVKALEL
ncbi:hypothetical protein HK101_007578 [Irineochytrium annulatum]|nr:hypothetical protein HK101_007578 [Irineochytrium annulatum]